MTEPSFYGVTSSASVGDIDVVKSPTISFENIFHGDQPSDIAIFAGHLKPTFFIVLDQLRTERRTFRDVIDFTGGAQHHLFGELFSAINRQSFAHAQHTDGRSHPANRDINDASVRGVGASCRSIDFQSSWISILIISLRGKITMSSTLTFPCRGPIAAYPGLRRDLRTDLAHDSA
ncbi:hypothetical protein KCP77_08195 [Salmonella enterica subsp. enterica]|nr:hypothetical protein KCP77_08195 [Salmonella enterica subsp. enterica]